MTCKICGKLNETWWYEYEGYNEEELRRNVVKSPACPCHHKTICPRCHDLGVFNGYCKKFKFLRWDIIRLSGSDLLIKYQTEHGIAYKKET